jgi:hypothetical protein
MYSSGGKSPGLLGQIYKTAFLCLGVKGLFFSHHPTTGCSLKIIHYIKVIFIQATGDLPEDADLSSLSIQKGLGGHLQKGLPSGKLT